MLIRDFTATDYEAYYEMALGLFNGPAAVHALPGSNMQNTFREIMEKSPYLRGVMIEHEGEIAGYCQLAFIYNNEIDGMYVWIDELFIKPGFRGLGLGTQVMQWVNEQYRGKAKKIRLEVSSDNPDALRLYKRLGYEEWPYIQFTKDIE